MKRQSFHTKARIKVVFYMIVRILFKNRQGGQTRAIFRIEAETLK